MCAVLSQLRVFVDDAADHYAEELHAASLDFDDDWQFGVLLILLLHDDGHHESGDARHVEVHVVKFVIYDCLEEVQEHAESEAVLIGLALDELHVLVLDEMDQMNENIFQARLGPKLPEDVGVLCLSLRDLLVTRELDLIALVLEFKPLEAVDENVVEGVHLFGQIGGLVSLLRTSRS